MNPPTSLERLCGTQPIREMLQGADNLGPAGLYMRSCSAEQRAVTAWTWRSVDGVWLAEDATGPQTEQLLAGTGRVEKKLVAGCWDLAAVRVSCKGEEGEGVVGKWPREM